MRRAWKHYRSNVEGRTPDPNVMADGEIAINTFPGKEKIFIKNGNNALASFASEAQISSALSALLELVNEKLNKAMYEGCNNVNTVSGIPIDKRLVYAEVGSNSSYSLNGIPASGEEIHTFIKNTGQNTITISIPNAVPYVISGYSDVVNIDSGKWGEINAISDGTSIYLRGI